jgi:hypothetical protein
MIFCVYLLPASQQNHLGAFIGFISASHDSDVFCTFHILHPKVFQKSFHTLITTTFLFLCIDKAHAIFISTSKKRSLTVAEAQGSTTI